VSALIAMCGACHALERDDTDHEVDYRLVDKYDMGRATLLGTLPNNERLVCFRDEGRPYKSSTMCACCATSAEGIRYPMRPITVKR
jgi:hypothetical protein